MAQWVQSGCQRVRDSCGLGDETLQFRIDPTRCVCLIVLLSSFDRLNQNTGVGENSNFPLHCSKAAAHQLNRLSKVEPTFRVAKEHSQNGLLGLPEQGLSY